MSKFSEDTFNHWKRPASESEEKRISNALSMIKDAINNSDYFNDKDIDIFIQGSYANNTNVRVSSDIDVCIMLKDTFYSEYPKDYDDDDYGFSEGTNSITDFKKEVKKALKSKFGKENVKQGNKSIKIKPNSYRVDADVIPSFQYRNYFYLNSSDADNYIEGIKFFSENFEEVINYPKIHIENGKEKNKLTKKRYKRLVRIFKRIRYKMIDDGKSVNKGISSFLLECLIWNVPNSYLNDYESWNERVKQAIIYLYNKTKNEKKCKDWGEVSEILYLFHKGRKWDVEMVNDYLVQVWNYLEFKN